MTHDCCEKADKFILETYHNYNGNIGYELLLADDNYYGNIEIGDDFIKYCPWCGEKLEVKYEA